MAYYKYLEKYTPEFLCKYQSGQYYNLARSSNYATLVNANSVQSLEVDEEGSFSWKAPLKLTNIIAALACFYWWQ